MEHIINYDVIIIGGSYAGLSAAMSLGRSLRKVLIIDSGMPCNRQTPHSHNFITQDGEKPGIISAKAKEQVLKYETVHFHQGLAVGGKKTEDGFAIQTESGNTFGAKKLVFATGIKDIMPNIKGFAECWGISVIHCPYCHGYEVRGLNTGLLANGDRAFHLASMIHNLTAHLTIFTNGQPLFSTEQLKKFENHRINIVEDELKEIIHNNGIIQSILFKNGNNTNLDALYASLPFEQHSDIPVALGCELTELGHIKVDALNKTSIAGMYACGDNMAIMRSVANAVAAGNLTGAMVNKELTEEQF